MRKKGMYKCVAAGGIALILLALLWLIVSAQAGPSDQLSGEGNTNLTSLSSPASEVSPLQGYTTTLYLPLVLHNYPPCESPPLNWASDPGGVLLRWRWPEWCAGPATFRVYRTPPGGTPTLITDTIAPVTDPAQAEAILSDDWPTIQSELDITTTDELHAVRTENPMQAAYLANLRYRVALVYGWGYSDTTAVAGTVYTYSVEAVRQRDGSVVSVGEVVAQAGNITPLSTPTGLTVTQVISEPLVGEIDWVKAQKNRKADRDIYLRWDVNQSDPPPTTTLAAAAASLPSPSGRGAGGEGLTTPWLVGYDIYRSETPTGPYTCLTERPIIPMSPSRPRGDDPNLPYELYDYFFQDSDPTLEYGTTYYYRVAPRDLLGQPRVWGNDEHKPQFSDYVEAIPRDTAPPPVPQDLTATPLHPDRKIVITWTAQTTDTVGYHLYWSWHPTASILVSPCTDAETCWVPLADVPDPATDVYTHTGIYGPLQQDKPYWYRIRAVDAADNLSAPSEPVHAVLHDRTPPAKPEILYKEYLFIDGPLDTADIFLYCSVDDGPYRLWKVLEPDADGDAVYELYDEYKPPVPTTLICQVQVADANGNRSDFSDPTSLIRLGPSAAKDPPAPIITVISTTGSAEKGWAAVVNWEAEPTPGVKGFRLYRQVYPSGSRVQLADESVLTRTARVFTDTTVEADKVYSYTVSIYRSSSWLYGPEVEVRSRRYLYEVVPPLGERSRQIVIIPWVNHYHDASGTHLSWFINQECHRSIVFRSMEKDKGYVQLTPPIDREDYLDSDAEHPNYWYVVHWIDCKTGEVIGRTEPWSAGATMAQEQLLTNDTAAPALLPLAPLLPAADLPPTLTLGWETEAEPFTLHNISYTVGSTLTNLSGSGVMTLGGGGLTPFTRTVPFYSLGADASGYVLTGTVIYPLNDQFEYPGGLVYTITYLYLDRHDGTGDVTLPLPAHIQAVSGGGIPYSGVNLPGVIVHPDLTFEYEKTGLSSDPCSVVTPTFYFEMNPLPLRIVPVSTISYTHMSILFDSGICTQYEERYDGTRPGYPDPDASDALLRMDYEAAGGEVWIGTNGLEGKLIGAVNIKWSIAVPYGLRFGATEVWLKFDDSQIVDGRVYTGSVGLLYYSQPPNYFGWGDPPDHLFSGSFDTLYVGQGGSLYGEIQATTAVEWDGYRLDDTHYFLYVPPIETQKMPWEEAIGQAPEEVEEIFGLEAGMESGLNKIGDADFTWLNCGRDVTFPDGVTANAYLRRGGVSDYFTATIPPGSGIEASLYGYAVYLTRFRLAFFDNELFDKDIVGDLTLPAPADIKLPLIDFHINIAGCVESARIREGSEPVLGLWQIQTHPTAVEFRPDSDPAFPDGMALWILGRIEIPHLALPTDDGSPADYESGLPLDMSLTPDGEFYAFEWKEESGRYLFDGFDFLIEEIRLSEAGPPIEQPDWKPDATLGDPPCTSGSCTQGFVELQGHLLTPLFGELEKDSTRSKLQFMTGSDFVGFTPRPQVKRGWTNKVGLGFVFDLLYAHDADEHAGRFVAWDQEKFLNAEKFGYGGDYLEVFSLDWAADISPEETGIYFGLSTVPALLRTLAETTMATVPTTFTEELSQTAWSEWFPALGITGTLAISEARGYLDLSSRLWVSVTDATKTTQEIDKLKDEDIPTTPKGGGTTGKLEDWGVNFGKIRGQAAFSDVKIGDEVVDWHLEELHISLQMTISWGTEKTTTSQWGNSNIASPYSIADDGNNGDGEDKDGSFIRARRITFRITRDGDYVLVGKKVRTTLAEDVKDIDFALLLNVKKPNARFEGGLILYKIEIEGVYFERVGAVLGVGEYKGDPFFYLGALGDVKFGPLREYTAGGALLFGTIYTDSIVLREMGFADLLDRLSDTGESGGLLVGGYVRAYGDFPIYDYGCVFQVTAGGEIAAWYFAALHGDDDAWGGRLRGYVYGKLLCVVSARGDLTLEIFHPGHISGTASYAFRGQFWVAGGIGWCSPGSWKSWESRWWGDSWCWCCGAIVWADYNYTAPDDWKWDYDADCE